MTVLSKNSKMYLSYYRYLMSYITNNLIERIQLTEKSG